MLKFVVELSELIKMVVKSLKVETCKNVSKSITYFNGISPE